MTDPSLRFQGAELGYGKQSVLAAFDLDVPAGAFVAITGRSGAGKSTLLRAAAGLISPLRGSLHRSVASVAWVPQADTLRLLHPVSAAEVAAGATSDHPRAQAALESLGLGGELRSRFSHLSGGQRQRVLMARALVMDADLLVLDEPTSALDDESSALVRAAAARRSAEGATVLYATHQPDEVRELETLRLAVADGQVTTMETDAWS